MLDPNLAALLAAALANATPETLTATKAISTLQALVYEHGDFPMWVIDDTGCIGPAVTVEGPTPYSPYGLIR